MPADILLNAAKRDSNEINSTESISPCKGSRGPIPTASKDRTYTMEICGRDFNNRSQSPIQQVPISHMRPEIRYVLQNPHLGYLVELFVIQLNPGLSCSSQSPITFQEFWNFDITDSIFPLQRYILSFLVWTKIVIANILSRIPKRSHTQIQYHPRTRD